ncbi:MAG: alkaline phosphatase family protein [Planctomycetota bacterium]
MPRSTLVTLLVLPFLAARAGHPAAPYSTLSPLCPLSPPAEGEGRVIVLGFDGADARTVEELMAEHPGRYPAFERLRREGSFHPLEVVAPPESPVSWAALNTGQNPAKTGVPGFVKRDLKKGEGPPGPALGHLVMDTVPLEAVEGAPLPRWSPAMTAAACGGGIFLAVLVVALMLLRGRLLWAAIPALVLGGGAAWAGHHARGLLPESFPHTSNPNHARNLWDYAGDAGVRCVVIDPAQAFAMPTPASVDVLWGLGVPDATNDLGRWAIYTTDPDEFYPPPAGRTDQLSAGAVYRVEEREEGRISTRIFGPAAFWRRPQIEAELAGLTEAQENPDLDFEEGLALSDRQRELGDELADLKAEGVTVPMEIELREGSARITIGGEAQEVAEGEWSDFYSLDFPVSPLVDVKAITRVRLISLRDPFFELFLNVLDIDPREPPFWQPISSPADYSAALAGGCGLYETYGWSTATMPVKDEEVDPELLMEDVEFTMKWRERLLYHELARDDWRLLMEVFSTTDRVQHMMYQFWDEEHPRYKRDPAAADREMTFFGKTIRRRDAIPAIYEQMDRIVGTVLAEHLRPEDTLIVCSDHGFQSCRTQVHLNNWLHAKGYLAVKPSLAESESQALAYVDWPNTTAYSLGMGFIYLNLRGREFQGTVRLEDADATIRRIKADLLAEDFVRDVYVTKEIHTGDHLNLEAELIVGFTPPHRISWSATSGGISLVKDDLGLHVPGPILEDNLSAWSGDHVSLALSAVPGVFFSNRVVEMPPAGLRALQIAPTVLHLLGVAVPAEMDLPPLVFAE